MTNRGILALNEDFEPLLTEQFDLDPEEVAKKFLKLEAGESFPELDILLKKLTSAVSSIQCIDAHLTDLVASQTTIPVSTLTDMILSKQIREQTPEKLIEAGLIESQKAFLNHLREVGMALIKEKLRRAGEERDRLVIQAVHAIDDINKMINLFASRVREWYGLHFPEADRLIEDHKFFLELVSNFGTRQEVFNAVVKGEKKVPKQLEVNLLRSAQDSVGAELSKSDITTIQQLSDAALNLYKRKAEIEAYITQMMQEVAPNVQGLVGSLLGARLIALAGGLNRIAKMPSSTIQVLGAEKALFRSLRTKALPPKHGIIFQFPEIHQSPRWQRGKIARALAGKLAIAARVDAFRGQNIAGDLRKSLFITINEIKTKFVKPPKRKKRQTPPKKKLKKRRTYKKKSG
ncbi:MAG: C/D box methylation guide ribonucleoprotein complex aNOP56 subunit [Candidatus Heimdallarchaeota archaeon]